jgi:hypothetical protein
VAVVLTVTSSHAPFACTVAVPPSHCAPVKSVTIAPLHCPVGVPHSHVEHVRESVMLFPTSCTLPKPGGQAIAPPGEAFSMQSE